ncbi:hypothetical protein AB835_08545 [Candidatus Endobugula sertula]|uniref:Uncharacterized protein n=1 Tax=Candidatus Endobugula sertula TaxID=62101 RepID=A0A1D2QPM4_9GAMM|nr:hypothetical protein AB835_08545 [Candidatus Endobugula sertula]
MTANPLNKKSKESIALQIVGLVLLLVFLVALSTVGTLITLGVIKTRGDAKVIGSMAGAEHICDQKVRADYGHSLSVATVDDRSSRYDNKSGQYKMFYELTIYQGNNKHSGVKTFYVNCYVSAKRGSISHIDYLEQKDFQPKAIRRRHGNAFGL